jgi:hypothetical protein
MKWPFVRRKEFEQAVARIERFDVDLRSVVRKYDLANTEREKATFNWAAASNGAVSAERDKAKADQALLRECVDKLTTAVHTFYLLVNMLTPKPGPPKKATKARRRS